MDEEEEKKKFETEENDRKGKKKRLNKEALCERLKISYIAICTVVTGGTKPGSSCRRKSLEKAWLDPGSEIWL